MKVPRLSSHARELIASLEEFRNVLARGERVEDHFRVTTVRRTEDGKIVRVRHPEPKRRKAK